MKEEEKKKEFGTSHDRYGHQPGERSHFGNT
jgi:hypothetical protein